MIYDSGTTSRSVDLQIVDDTGLGVTGLLAATFPPMIYSLAGANADVAFPSLSDLAAIGTAWAAGGVKERSGGWYRVDLPDGVFTTAGVVTIRGDATGKHVILDPLDIAPAVNLTRILGSQLTESVGGYIAAGFKKLCDVATPVFTLASVNQTGDVYPAIDTEIAAIKNKTDNLPANPAAVGSQMTLDSTERNSVAAAVWSSATSGLVAVNSIGKRITEFMTTLVYATPLDATGTRAALGMASNDLDTQLDAILAASGGGGGGSTPEEIAEAVLETQLTESYAADGVAPTLTQAVLLLLQKEFDVSISGTTMTVKRLDGTTTAATATLNSSTAPTSIARAT